MSARGERLEGIKAYEGTIESAEQTLSFLITFIFGRERKCCRGGMCTRNPETLLSLQLYEGKKKRKNSYWYTRPKGSFKENSTLFDFSPKTIMNVQAAPTIGPPPLQSLLSPVSVRLFAIDRRDSWSRSRVLRRQKRAALLTALTN